MPIFGEEQDAPIPSVINPNPTLTETASLTYNLSKTTLSSIITHVTGSRWILTYYSQYVNDTGEVAGGNEETTLPLYQQFKKIYNFELKVTSPLAEVFDETEQETNVEGEATVALGFIPNIGDVMVADIDGRFIQFNVISSVRNTMFKDASYSIRFRASTEHIGDAKDTIEAKVQTEAYFVFDMIQFGKYPILAESEFNQYNKIRDSLAKLPDVYYSDFYDPDNCTFLVPDQTDSTYDPELMKFIMTVIELKDHPNYANVRQYNCDNHKDIHNRTIFDIILTRNIKLVNTVSVKSAVVPSSDIRQSAIVSTIFASNICNVYYPTKTLTKLGITTTTDITPSESVVKLREFDAVAFADGVIPVKAVTEDDYYVFSEIFYRGQEGMTLIETLVDTYVETGRVNANDVVSLLDDSYNWDAVERFYYIPIVLFLASNAIREIN